MGKAASPRRNLKGGQQWIVLRVSNARTFSIILVSAISVMANAMQ